MFSLKAENRNVGLKPKQLRREGIIPGVLYGKNLEESISMQFTQKDVSNFLKTNSTGSKVELAMDGKKYISLLREVTFTPATTKVEHLSFQTLLADEVIESTARIILLNKEKVQGMLQAPQSEISFKALPANLIDKIEIDLEGFKEGDSIRVGDLEAAKNPDIEVLTPLENMVVSVIEPRATETPETEEQGEAEADAEEN